MAALPVGVPQTFTRTEGAVASYDWKDLTTSLGYRTYYGAAGIDSVSTKYILSPTTVIRSAKNVFTLVGVSWSVNLDISIGRPCIIGGGNAYFTFYIVTNYSDDNCPVTATVIHYDGSTETTIGTATYTVPKASAFAGYYGLFIIPVSVKKFKIGDTLRLKYEASVSFGHTVTSYLDSSGLSSTNGVLFHCPFKIDI